MAVSRPGDSAAPAQRVLALSPLPRSSEESCREFPQCAALRPPQRGESAGREATAAVAFLLPASNIRHTVRAAQEVQEKKVGFSLL